MRWTNPNLRLLLMGPWDKLTLTPDYYWWVHHLQQQNQEILWCKKTEIQLKYFVFRYVRQVSESCFILCLYFCFCKFQTWRDRKSETGMMGSSKKRTKCPNWVRQTWCPTHLSNHRQRSPSFHIHINTRIKKKHQRSSWTNSGVKTAISELLHGNIRRERRLWWATPSERLQAVSERTTGHNLWRPLGEFDLTNANPNQKSTETR